MFCFGVAPRAGAWIETENWNLQKPNYLVAPRAGAWIETRIAPLGDTTAKVSLLVQERGLKLNGLLKR